MTDDQNMRDKVTRVESRNACDQIVFCAFHFILSGNPNECWLCTCDACRLLLSQRVKKVVPDSPGLEDFAIGLVNFVLNLPDGQLKCFEEFK